MDYHIVVRTDTKKLDLYRNGVLFHTYNVAVGKPSSPTPKGSFTVKYKHRNPGGAYGTRWLGLSAPHIGIHGTNNPASIGTAASKGCIRMHNKDIEALFELISVGNPVRII